MTGTGAKAERTTIPVAVDPWVLAYDGFDPEQEGLREALCALGNGVFATRGAAEETQAGSVHYPGTYLAGGYNRLESEVAGQTVVNEDLVNFPNWLPLQFAADADAWVTPESVEILSWRQELHLRNGLLIRTCRVRDDRNRITKVVSRRIVSMSSPHLAALEVCITPENWSGFLRVRSGLDGGVTNTNVARYRQLSNRHLQILSMGAVAPEGIWLLVQTSESRIQVGEAARTRVFFDAVRLDVERRIIEGTDRIAEEFRVEAAEGETVRVEKVVAFHSSRDRGTGEPGSAARRAICHAPGFNELFSKHRLAWQALWRRYDIEIGTRDTRHLLARDQLILRLHIFHMLQTVSFHTIGMDVGAPARGLHGEAYRGHIFWDELFILPFYNLRTPANARSLLLYRYYRLDAARQLAREAGFDGAMFPWQSSSDGREATQMLHLNPLSGRWHPDYSRLQRHVNAAIVYNFWQYYHASGDRAFLYHHGAEVVLEIARFWASIARWNVERQRYEIVGVMGPDEYHEKYPDADAGGLRNNAYTNVMAVWTLLRAFDVLDEIGQSRRAEIMAMLGIGESDFERWDYITRHMFIPFHDTNIISQFEGYEHLREFDWEAYRARYGHIERLDRILRAEGDSPDRYKVSKQADVNMLFYLLDREELRRIFERLGYPFDDDAIRRNISYYMDRTSHGSTLSKMVFASVVDEVDCDEACRLFFEALRSDIDDTQKGTTSEGIHLGAMAGTVAIVLRRFAGVRLGPQGVVFQPSLPGRLGALRFRVHWRGRWLHVDLTAGHLRLTADRDRPDPIPVIVRGQMFEAEPGRPLEVSLEAA